MATIKEKILADHERIMSEPTADLQKSAADEVGKLAAKAVKGGIKSAAWALYMSRYCDKPEQLMRLCGEDPDFNESPWSEQCLAYLPSNGVCTITSRRAPINDTINPAVTNQGTLNYMDADMIGDLDF